MRKFLLVSLLMFGTQTVSVISGSPSLGGEAYAADFTGKIKRIRIKRRAGSGFQIRVTSQVDGGDIATGAVLKLTDPTTNAILFEGEQSVTRSAKARYAATISRTVTEYLARGLTLELTVSAADGTTTTFEGVDITTADGSSEWVEGAEQGGLKFRARVSDGSVQVIVLNEDGSWLPVSRDGVKLRWLNSDRQEVDSQAIAAPDDVVQSYVFEVSAEQLSVDEVSVSSMVTVGRIQATEDGELTSEALGTVTSSTLSQVPGSDATTDRIERVVLKETPRGDNRLVVYTSTTDGSIGAIEAQIAAEDSDAYILDTFDESPVRRTRVFAEPGIAFTSGVEKVLGYTYKLGIDLRNGDGKAVRETIQMEVALQSAGGFDDLSVGDVVGAFDFGDGLGEGVFVYEEGGTLGVVIEWGGEDVAEITSAGVTITAPEGASAPVNDAEVADLAYEVNKWVMKAEGSIREDSSAAVDVTLVDDKGNVLDTVSVSGVAGDAGRLSNDDLGFLEKDYLDVLSEQATDEDDNSDE